MSVSSISFSQGPCFLGDTSSALPCILYRALHHCTGAIYPFSHWCAAADIWFLSGDFATGQVIVVSRTVMGVSQECGCGSSVGKHTGTYGAWFC